MPKQRRTTFLLVLVCALLLIGLRWFLSSARSPSVLAINEESYGRIQIGMQRPEVEALLGVPPGDYRHRLRGDKVYAPLDGDVPANIGKNSGLGLVEWWADEYVIFLWVDAQGRVAGKALNQPLETKPRSWWDRARGAMGW
jgi:hypothetical protein